jgi:hypothetical protein
MVKSVAGKLAGSGDQLGLIDQGEFHLSRPLPYFLPGQDNVR